jgi:hypothetical protein
MTAFTESVRERVGKRGLADARRPKELDDHDRVLLDTFKADARFRP